jgi:hypothetical protein
MLLNEQSLALHNTVQEMGYESLEDFALQKARQDLLQEIAISQKKIEDFEKKYGIDYADFCKDFQKLKQPLFEKEEDSAEWNAEVKLLSILQKRLARIS